MMGTHHSISERERVRRLGGEKTEHRLMGPGATAPDAISAKYVVFSHLVDNLISMLSLFLPRISAHFFHPCSDQA
jgi:hypothetical protein